MGARAAARRRELKLSQIELADLAGISRATLIRLEKGDTNIMLRNLFSVARELRVSVGQLLSENEVEPTSKSLDEIADLVNHLQKVVSDAKRHLVRGLKPTVEGHEPSADEKQDDAGDDDGAQ